MLSRRRFSLPTARGTWAVARCSGSGGYHWVILWEAEAEGSLRLTPAGSPHRPAADHHLSVFGISAGIERCAYVRISSVQQQYVVYGANRSCFLYLSKASAQVHHCARRRGRNGQMARPFDSRGAYRRRSFDQCTPVLSHSFPCYPVLVGACSEC